MIVPTKAEMRAYEVDGYFIRKSLLSDTEVDYFRDLARQQLEDQAKSRSVMQKGDSKGNKTLLKLWNHAGDDM